MSNVFYTAVLLTVIVAGNVIARRVTWLPLPIILTILGILMSLIPAYHQFTIDPAVFIMLIIAPLLYHEAQSASRYWIGRGIINVVSLALILIVVTVVITGVTIHWLVPAFALSLAFAFTAIITPTDASTVNALSSDSNEFKTPMTILQNEALFNDASGIVLFNVALASYVSQQFSLVATVSQFLVTFFGGLVVGLICGWLLANLQTVLIHAHDDVPLITVSLEISTPFIVYFLANLVGVSGILAVVIAGLIQGADRNRLRLTSSRIRLVSNNVWEILDGLLSGFVFILLGLSAPLVIHQVSVTVSHYLTQLLVIGLIAFIIKLVIRLLWSRYFLWLHQKSPHRWRDSLVIAVSGASGPITLSLAFALPVKIGGQIFVWRPVMILMAAEVVLISLVVPAVLLPFLTKQTHSLNSDTHRWIRRMLTAAIDNLKNNQQHPAESQIVIDALSQQLSLNHAPNRRQERRLFSYANRREQAAVEQAWHDQKISQWAHDYYLRFLGLSHFAADQNIWKNLLLRIWFGFRSGQQSGNFQAAQETFLTSPVVMEQIFWQRQFTEHHEDIRGIERLGYHAVMRAIAATGTTAKDERPEVNTVRRFYRERHRRISYPTPDTDVIYRLFLAAFHAEYVFIQNSVTRHTISVQLAEQLQQRITFDEITYIQNSSEFMD